MLGERGAVPRLSVMVPRALFNWLIILSVGWAIKGVGALVMRALEGPTLSVTRGTDIILHCRYELEMGDRLYAVKWFRGRREFYRFRPDLEPPIRIFPVEDVQVDIESSNDERVVIRHVVPGSSGIYRCEVSAEGTFETDYREINITILDTPMGDPVIYNIQSRYSVGDLLNINCSSFESRPAAQLAWFINGQQPEKEDEEVTHYPVRWTAPSGGHSAYLETSTLGLTIRQLRPDHFVNGALSIVCQAELGSTRRRSTGVKAILMDPPAPLFDKRRSAQPHQTGISSNNRHRPNKSLILILPLLAVFTWTINRGDQ